MDSTRYTPDCRAHRSGRSRKPSVVFALRARGHSIKVAARSDTARRVQQPALVLHARDDGAVPYEEGRLLASLLPDARFVTLEADNHVLQEGEPAWDAWPPG